MDVRARDALSRSFETLSGDQVEAGVQTLKVWAMSLRQANQVELVELAERFTQIRKELELPAR